VLDKVSPPEEFSHSFTQQYEVFLNAFPICLVAAGISVFAMVVRAHHMDTIPLELLGVKHPFASQAVCVITGFLLVARLQDGVKRYFDSATAIELLQSKICDACS